MSFLSHFENRVFLGVPHAPESNARQHFCLVVAANVVGGSSVIEESIIYNWTFG